jgi:phosphopantetheinyl transferase (holo-ACP synthase)
VTTAVGAPRLLFGVDAVPVDRVSGLVATFGSRLARRVATAAEAAWAGGSAERLAALLAAKESAIKCLAGRPPGFRWQCVETVPGPVAVPAAVADTLAAFAAGVRLADGRDAACRVSGTALDRARAVLGTGAGVRGVARVGTVDGHVLAVVCLWEETDVV